MMDEPVNKGYDNRFVYFRVIRLQAALLKALKGLIKSHALKLNSIYKFAILISYNLYGNPYAQSSKVAGKITP